MTCDAKCDKCGLEITTGAMAAFCPNHVQCEFWPHSDGTHGQDGAELLIAKMWIGNAVDQISMQIEDRKRLEQEKADLIERHAKMEAEHADALRALRECEERAGKIEAERDSFKGYAESLHGWMDRVLSCVERAEQDIGGETMGAIILAGGPIYESFSEYLAALAAKGNGNG